jgi:hypothetical protein
MITDLWIENFKGIGKRQHIPLRPITLLFGANSAGKSTILHALLYLREIVSFQNVDPAKSLAGSQSIGLGGLDNLRHVSSDGSDAGDVILGCKVVFGLPGTPPNLHTNIWEYPFYSNETNYIGYGFDQTSAEQSNFSDDVEACFQSYTDEYDYGLEWKLNVSIGRSPPWGSTAIQYVEIVVDETPLMCGCTGSSDKDNSFAWWVNIWHRRLFPKPEFSDDEPENVSATRLNIEKRKRLFDKIQLQLQSADLIEFDITKLYHPRGLVSFNVLELPTRPQYFSGPGSEVQEHGQVLRLILDHRLVTLDSFLNVYASDKLREKLAIGTGWDGVFVILNQLTNEDGNQHDYTAIGVGVLLQEASSLDAAIETVRLACLEEALAGRFRNDSDRNRFPTIHTRGFGCDKAIEQPGMSLLGAVPKYIDLFDLHRSRLDQILRMGIKLLGQCLSDFCYVGPKRSTVPRYLNSDMMDEHINWGDGLGAWRWLLHCEDHEFAECDEWLSRNDPGFKTGFNLEREHLRELPERVVDMLQTGLCFGELTNCSPDEFENFKSDLKNSRVIQRITLRDVATRRRRHPQDVGEGITQVIPVIAALVANSKGGFCGIEQPELHLHPSLAAKLGDLVITKMLTEFHLARALIETHSEHLILRILRRIRQTTDGELPEHIPPVKPDNVCVLWVDNLGDGTTIQRLRIDERGEFIDRWPAGFFSERAEELF